MKKKNAFTLLVLLSLLLTQLAVVPATALAASCDAAQFVADIKVPDGTTYKAGDTFEKVWRLKNVGTCTWSKSYSLVYDSGNQMSASSPVAFPQSVAPGGTIDLSVNMTAPSTSGLIRGYWKLKNASGTPFGIGINADKAFWVEIRVKTADDGGGTGFDFVQKAGDAAWTSGTGTLPFPGTAADVNGAGLKVDNPKLEDGSAAGAPGLLMMPQNTYNGFVQAQYPAYTVKNGDHFKSIVNCEYNATSCWVNFRLDYQIGSGAVKTFWSFNEAYDRQYYPADRDLSSLAGQDVKFILRVGAAGYAAGDHALWDAPRIVNVAGGPVPTSTPGTPVPTVTAGPTKTPGGCSDKMTFISDLDVPDGKVFAPDTTFVKKWSIKNTGTCTWTTAYKLVYVSGEKIGATSLEINLASTINPNTTINTPELTLKAPSANGSYRGYWQFKNAQGELFGLGAANQPFWVDITVKGGTAQVTPTNTSIPAGPDRATFLADVTVPDGQVFNPSTSFTKTWRIKNTGTSTWGSGYKLVFASGDRMSGPTDPVSLASTVLPNGEIEISVSLISPASNGHFKGFWQLQNASGKVFGIGSTADKPFWVDINVTGASTSVTATSTTAAAPTVTATATVGATATVTATPGMTATLTVTPTPIH